MTRNDPRTGNASPITVQAVWDAMQEALVVSEPPAKRQAKHGKRYVVSERDTITVSDDTLYIYINNPHTEMSVSIGGANIYTTGEMAIDVYDEPAVDESTFSNSGFSNLRSSVTADPPWNAYSGLDPNVTITDMGRLFLQDQISSGPQSAIGQRFESPGYIIDSESSALFAFRNIDGNAIDTAISIYAHETIPVPDLTTFDTTDI